MDIIEITKIEKVDLGDTKRTISSLQTEIAILDKLSDKEKVARYNAEFIDPLKRKLESEQKTLTDLSAYKVETKDVNNIQ
jgi:hypothetical protein